MGCCCSKPLYTDEMVSHFPPLAKQTSILDAEGERIFRNTAWKDKLAEIPQEVYKQHSSQKNSNTLLDVWHVGMGEEPSAPCFGWREGGKGPFKWLEYRTAYTDYMAKISKGLRTLGLEPEARLGFYSKNRPEWMLCEIACYMQKMVTVSLYDTLGPNAVQYILSHSECQGTFCSEECFSKLAEALRTGECPRMTNVFIFEDKSEWSEETNNEVEALTAMGITVMSLKELREHSTAKIQPTQPKPEDLAIIMYTSGTTDTPKGVMLTHGNMVAAMAGIATNLPIFSKNDVMLSYLPLAHIFQRVAEFAFIGVGGSIGYYSGSPLTLLDDVAELKPTIFVGVPRVFDRIYDRVWGGVKEAGGMKARLFTNGFNKKQRQFRERGETSTGCYDCLVFSKAKQRLGGKVHTIISGGGPLRPQVQEFLRLVFLCNVVQGYGLTETCAGATVALVNDPEVGHIGPPIGSCELKLIDATDFGYPLSVNPNKGELCVRGPNVFKGYYKDEEKTADAFVEGGWFRTGDIAEFTQAGTFKIIDRAKNIFKNVLGEYIAPEKLEGIFNLSELAGQTFVYGEGFKATLVAVVVPSEDTVFKWFQSKNIDPSTDKAGEAIKALVENKEWNALFVSDLMEQFGKLHKDNKLNGFERISAVALEHDPWTVDNGMLTPTQKPKRPQLTARYREVIADLYDSLEGVGASGSGSGGKSAKPVEAASSSSAPAPAEARGLDAAPPAPASDAPAAPAEGAKPEKKEEQEGEKAAEEKKEKTEEGEASTSS